MERIMGIKVLWQVHVVIRRIGTPPPLQTKSSRDHSLISRPRPGAQRSLYPLSAHQKIPAYSLWSPVSSLWSPSPQLPTTQWPQNSVCPAPVESFRTAGFWTRQKSSGTVRARSKCHFVSLAPFLPPLSYPLPCAPLQYLPSFASGPDPCLPNLFCGS